MPQASVHVRLPASLHQQLAARAVEEGVSFSLLAATLLAAAINFNLRPDEPATEAESSREDDEAPVPNVGDDLAESSAPEQQPAAATEAAATEATR